MAKLPIALSIVLNEKRGMLFSNIGPSTRREKCPVRNMQFIKMTFQVL